MRQEVVRWPGEDLAVRSWHHETEPVHRMLALPYAGAGATVFKPLAIALGPAWRVSAIELPGHGLGSESRPLDDVTQMAELIFRCIPEDQWAGSFVLGYSLGGYIAHQLVARLEAQPITKPAGAILCAATPYCHRTPFGELGDDVLFDRLLHLGGIPRELESQRELFDLFAPVIRADLRAYDHHPEPKQLLQTETLIIGGEEDQLCRPAGLPDWSRYVHPIEIAMVPGPHIFLKDSAVDIARHIARFAQRITLNS